MSVSAWLRRHVVGAVRVERAERADAAFEAVLAELRARRGSTEEMRQQMTDVTAELAASARALASMFPGPHNDDHK